MISDNVDTIFDYDWIIIMQNWITLFSVMGIAAVALHNILMQRSQKADKIRDATLENLRERINTFASEDSTPKEVRDNYEAVVTGLRDLNSDLSDINTKDKEKMHHLKQRIARLEALLKLYHKGVDRILHPKTINVKTTVDDPDTPD